MACVMLINLYTVRIVLQALGAEDYGIYNVVAGIATMFTSVTGVLSSTTQRYYSYALGGKDTNSLRDIFSASINIFLIISSIILCLGETIGLWFINTQLVIPDSRIGPANWIYQFALMSVLLMLMQTPFSSAAISHEDMYIFAIISTIECILKLIFAFAINHIVLYDHLVIYGLSIMLVNLFTFIWYAMICHKKYNECTYHKVKEKELHIKLLSFSGWTLLTSGASIAMNQIVTILLNIFFGPIVSAARAISIQVSSAISTFTNSFIMAVQPSMVKSYAGKNELRLNNLFYLGNKLILYGLLMICIPLYFEMETILELWLGPTDNMTISFCKIIVVYSIILSLNNPISIIVQATGKLRQYVIPVETITLLTPLVIYVIFKIGGSAISSLYVMLLMISITHIVRILCLARIYVPFSIKQYLKEFIYPGIISISILVVIALITHNALTEKYSRLIISISATLVMTIILVFKLALNTEEKTAIKELLHINKHTFDMR